MRSDPEELLQRIKKEELESCRGHLTVFFGYAAGVGKTYAMLKAAHAAKRCGIDIVAGYIEPHARSQTARLINGLEVLPVKEIEYKGVKLHEFDLDAALARKPELILIDELAHTNVEGSRHDKRYQDVEELLDNGINVFTTINVQHIESLNDLVESITGIVVNESVPDFVFDEASQVKLIDIEPEELIERFNEGKVYQPEQAGRALDNFFTIENLAALREIALRRSADRMNKLSESSSGRAKSRFTDEHIMVCLSSSPSNGKIIRAAARMANAFKGTFIALYVETPDFVLMSQAKKDQLRRNIRIAQQLGATIATAYGEDVAYQVVEFARLSNISKIVLGRSYRHRIPFFEKQSLVESIIRLSPDLDLYIIPSQTSIADSIRNRKVEKPQAIAIDTIKSIAILALATLIGYAFYTVGFNVENIITVYILAVLVISVVTSHRIYGLVSSLVSVLLFNFMFIEPRFSLDALQGGYLATFFIMFVSAFLTSSLAARLKKQARQSAATAYRTQILFETSRLIGNENDAKGIISITCRQLTKLLNKSIVFYGVQNGELNAPQVFPIHEDGSKPIYVDEKERAVVLWAYLNNKRAGASTDTLDDSKYLYLPVKVGEEVFGVIGIFIDEKPLDAFENSIVLSILTESALALKNDIVSNEREAARLIAKNEQLRANLLRSISHDLRTPLTSISGNAGILLTSEERIGKEKRKQLYADIYNDSHWLINLVENLLSMTRIEEGATKLSLTTELLDDIISEAYRHVEKRSGGHTIQVEHSDSFIFVKVDAWLIVQVIVNLIDNAIKYTPEDSHIVLEAKEHDGMAEVSISDNGEGIPDEAKKHIFDMFYTVDTNADSRRSLGLGLALCKSILLAHGGDIRVRDNVPQGTVFTFTLPVEEVDVHNE